MSELPKEDVHRETSKRGRGALGCIIGAAIGVAAGTGIGMHQEFKHDRLYERGIKESIRDAAVEGYAWKEGVNPKFYDIERPALILNPETMTMHGHLYAFKRDSEGAITDTIDYGPILHESVGYTITQKMGRQVEEDVNKVKQAFERAGEWTKNTYRKTDSTIREWLRKDEPQDTLQQRK
ncbi:hypothetical protein JXA12_00410 [Candidatus Woesearchaeota archaeon]|nr:hypothetical protein [Candidatus Woesearchaeota archaeon]